MGILVLPGSNSVVQVSFTLASGKRGLVTPHEDGENVNLRIYDAAGQLLSEHLQINDETCGNLMEMLDDEAVPA